MKVNVAGALLKPWRALILGMSVAGIVSGSVIGCDRDRHDPSATVDAAKSAALEVRAIKPSREDIVRKIVLPGTVRADLSVTLFSKVTGFLKDITKDRGDKVTSGELIATIEIPEMISEIDHARASAALDESTYKRLEGIRKVEKTAVTDQDLDMARAKRDMSKATLKKLETLQSYTEIRAPFGGYVTERFVDPGAFIQQGRIVSMVDTSKVRVLVDVPESEVRAAEVGTAAEVQFDALPGKTYAAAVSRSADALDVAMRTMRVEIDVKNQGSLIYPGMFARVCLEVDPHPMALVLPTEAVTLRQDRAFVFIDENGKAKKIPVTLGTESDHRWEILKGLSGNESILISEGKSLIEGAPVRLVEAAKPPQSKSVPGGKPTRTAEAGGSLKTTAGGER